jgi:hypothetical protein
MCSHRDETRRAAVCSSREWRSVTPSQSQALNAKRVMSFSSGQTGSQRHQRRVAGLIIFWRVCSGHCADLSFQGSLSNG